MIEYKIKAKNWVTKEFDKARTAILWVSLSRPDTKDDKLASTVRWLDTNFAGGWIVDLADTLNRHNFMALGNVSADAAETRARSEGQQWLADQSPHLKSAQNLKQIITFDYWRAKEDFPSTHQEVRTLFDENRTYHDAVIADAGAFVLRRLKEGAPEDRSEDLLKAGANYIMEESAAGILAAREFGGVRFYPGAQLTSLAFLRSDENLQSNGLFNESYVEISLERKKNQDAMLGSATSASVEKLSPKPPIADNQILHPVIYHVVRDAPTSLRL